MRVNDSKSYLGYLEKLVDQYNNTYHLSFGKTFIDADYSAFTEEIRTTPKASKFKVIDRVRISKYKNVFSKVYSKNWLREIFIIGYEVKTYH